MFLLLLFIGIGINSRAQIAGTPGLDGAAEITKSINTYFPPAGPTTLNSGSTTINLGAVPATNPLVDYGQSPIKAGDMLLLIQMQDATINSQNDASYGSGNPGYGPGGLGGTGYLNLNSTGLFEYVIATNNVALSGGTLTFKGMGAGHGTVNSYTSAEEVINSSNITTLGKKTFQVIRVPQYSNLKLSADILTPPFNGTVGGIIVFDVAGIMDFNGFTIDASGRGFRGGVGPQVRSDNNTTELYVTNTGQTEGNGKGEGIAGTPRYTWDGTKMEDNGIVMPNTWKSEGLPGGSYGKGAPGNAGGGGNDHNSGGGGGGNGGFGGVGGDGAHDVLETLIKAGVTPFPNGGRPGSVTYSSPVPDNKRVTMGGGGGGGDGNQYKDYSRGGSGGGIILINAGRIIGNGSIKSNGKDGLGGTFNPDNTEPDGSAGGGAGGTIYIKVSNPDPTAVLTIEAKGGNGGNTENDDAVIHNQVEHGPGGGGGGGLVFYNVPSATVNISKGLAGKTMGGTGSNHNAQDGTDGKQITLVDSSLDPYLQGGSSISLPILTTSLKENNPTGIKYPGSIITYTVTTTNSGIGNAADVRIEILLPTGITYKSATSSSTASGSLIISNSGSLSNVLLGDITVAAGDKITITILAEVDCLSPAGTYQAKAQASYLDPLRTSAFPARRITALTNAFAGSNTSYESGVVVPGSNFDGNLSGDDDVIVAASTPITNNSITIAGGTSVLKLCVNSITGAVAPPLISGSTPTAAVASFSFQWESSTDNINFFPIPSATSNDCAPPPIALTTYYRRKVSSACNTGAVYSNTIEVVISELSVANFDLPVFCVDDVTATFINTSYTEDGSALLYHWDFGDPASLSNTSTQKDGVHDFTTPGDYIITLRVSSLNECVAEKKETFTVAGIPKADFSVTNDAKLCSSNPVEFVDNATIDLGEINKVEWYYDFDNNPSDVLVDLNPGLRADHKVYSHKYPIFTSPASLDFNVVMKVYSGNTCVDIKSTIITVHAMPEIEFNPIPPVCLSDPEFPITQATEKSGLTGTESYLGTGVSPTGLFNPAVAGPGTHTIIYTFKSDASDCTDSKAQDVVVSTNPIVNNEVLDIMEGETVTLPSIANTSGLTYQWSPSVTLSNPAILNPAASPVETTTYELTVSDIITGCTSVGTIKVIVNKMPDISNTFTPNGDGINDYWIIKNLDTYQDCIVNVYNRYGETVFNSVGYQTPWDGTYKGKDMPSATYYYIINPKKGRKPMIGSITILR